MALSKEQIAKLAAELNAPVARICDRHAYAGGPKMPTPGCRQCHMAFWMAWLKETPPDKRQERLEQLQQLVHHMCEEEDKGIFDVKLYPYPVFKREPKILEN